MTSLTGDFKGSKRIFVRGGGVGIRTLDALSGHTHLAGEHLRPLGHSSAQIRIIPEIKFQCQFEYGKLAKYLDNLSHSTWI